MENKISGCNSTQHLNAETSAFTENLLISYVPNLHKIAFGILRNRDDAADAVQETLLRALRASHTLDSSRPLGPWLRTICANVCRDVLRSGKRVTEPVCIHNETLAAPQLLEDEVIYRCSSAAMWTALNRLPSNYRDILLMRVVDDMDIADIARQMDRPEGTIKCWMHRARTMLAHDEQLRQQVLVA